MACNRDLQKEGAAYPRTCAECGLGPCKEYPTGAQLQFRIEQVALCPRDPARAIALLTEMGLGEWARDHVVARGKVLDVTASNAADLAFNYEGLREARELEVLHYVSGENWMRWQSARVSHFGMHVTADELEKWRKFFIARSIFPVQEVVTLSHTNQMIAGQRWYHYVIFNTYEILGVDIKFIIRSSEAPRG